jgi:Tol biopolymer transport system component
MNRDGSDIRQLTFGDMSDCMPSYSPDGKRIFFARSARLRGYSMGGEKWDDWDVWEMNADGSAVRQLTYGRYYGVDSPHLSPDGKHVLFAADIPSGPGEKLSLSHSLLMFDVDPDGFGTKPRAVPLPPDQSNRNYKYDGDPSFSPDGSSIVFTSLRVSRDSPFDYEIWTCKVDGTGLRQITHNQSRDRNPMFSPDMKYIYYRSTEGLWRLNLNDNSSKQLAP